MSPMKILHLLMCVTWTNQGRCMLDMAPNLEGSTQQRRHYALGPSQKFILLALGLNPTVALIPAGLGGRFVAGKSPSAQNYCRHSVTCMSDSMLDGDLNKLTVVKLKDKLRASSLKVSGRKAELIARLEEHFAKHASSQDPSAEHDAPAEEVKLLKDQHDHSAEHDASVEAFASTAESPVSTHEAPASTAKAPVVVQSEGYFKKYADERKTQDLLSHIEWMNEKYDYKLSFHDIEEAATGLDLEKDVYPVLRTLTRIRVKSPMSFVLQKLRSIGGGKENEERRICGPRGRSYSKQTFQDFYGDDWQKHWDIAVPSKSAYYGVVRRNGVQKQKNGTPDITAPAKSAHYGVVNRRGVQKQKTGAPVAVKARMYPKAQWRFG
mmetsp:Transcript_163972/g.299131  ORF Transcript_163972/g.299131 Transcript_163972/m.299131 type:complete len:379 (-) Transcript_163972:139-1275(-)